MSWRTEANLAWLRALPRVEEGKPLARHTSFNIGGPAAWFCELGRVDEVERVVEEAARRGVPYLILGAGTNLLIADSGFDGLVLRVVNREHQVDGSRVRAGAGLKMMRLARLAADAGLVGFEFAIGVPGSVGGAVYQDAGCWGRELREVLVEVEGYVPGEGRATWPAESLGLGYRTSAFREGPLHGALITAATIELRPGDGEAAKREMARLTAERNRTQPIKTKNCGSVFKNPPADSAGRLVEAAGLKGAWEGRAQISDLHANFIVNHGGAGADDVRRLIERAIAAVREQFDVELEPEVELVGFAASGGQAGEGLGPAAAGGSPPTR
ncbi:MAG: UDP-N-acetylmuramate dehydrogenase [Chloroflexi bacterium]|nr:MAG: UDP-N-acetylmuramate dehydrogenase [Chloroflexota bacterium]